MVLLISFIFLFFSACKKEDYREIYVGEYKSLNSGLISNVILIDSYKYVNMYISTVGAVYVDESGYFKNQITFGKFLNDTLYYPYCPSMSASTKKSLKQ